MDTKKGKDVKEAIAIRYTPEEDRAPKIVAAGKGEAAEKILRTARESGVPVYNNPDLAHTLGKLSIGTDIPSELYEVVAGILVFVSSLDKKYGDLK